MKNIPLLLVTLLATVGLVVGVAMLFSRQAEPKVLDVAMVKGEARLQKGTAQAAVTIVEFSDFQCPACKAVQPLVKQVLDKYPDKVQFVYRHYPLLQVHPYALLAAQASEVAAEQGKFWEMHDQLFATQTSWAELKSEKEVKEQFATLAGNLGIDKAAFLEKIDSEAIKQRVAADMAAGNQIKLQATPTFFVNGRQVPAPQQLLTTVESFLQ